MFTLFICLIAGMGAGLGTGLAGMSAACVISPMLITFLHIPAYQAIGIALASDVLASAISAYTYYKNDNIDLRNGIIMLITVLTSTLVASYISSFLPEGSLGGSSMFMTLLVGLKFIFRPVMTTKEVMKSVSKQKRMIQSLLSGIVIGMICGFIGAGGGMMILLVLTSILGYELKTAVGTSVFIMSFTALTGSISHFMIGGLENIPALLLCILFTLLFARVAALFANRVSSKKLNQATGVVLTMLGIIILVFNYIA